MGESPCSVPDWLRFALPLETPRQQRACRRHDDRYAMGGDSLGRLVNDLVFPLDLLGGDPELLEAVRASVLACTDPERMSPERAEQYLWAVRMYGGTHWPGGDAPGTLPPAAPPALSAEAP